MAARVFYHWQSSRKLMAFAVVPRMRFGYNRTLFCRAWSFGPFTFAITNLDRP